VSALVPEGFAIDTMIRQADDHEAWVLEFARVGGDKDCLSYSHRPQIKTYKTCAARLGRSRRNEESDGADELSKR